MNILESAFKMLKKYLLCDHCLGRQFALLGHGMENDERGKVIKSILTMEANLLVLLRKKEGIKNLEILATNGFFKIAEGILHKMEKRPPSRGLPKACFLCDGKFQFTEDLVGKALREVEGYEYSTFLVGIELPVGVEEREDEFKAEFGVNYSENIRNEFGRILGKRVAELVGKTVEYRKPEIVLLVDPFAGEIEVQVNPLFFAGRYKKLVRGIPQSKWFCLSCRGKGCEKCNWTGKMYPESVEEIIAKPFLDVTEGDRATFHASGREDIDARMLGKGRPFVIEISKPKRRLLNLKKMERDINEFAKEKIEVSGLRCASKDDIRKLKRAEAVQKEYRVIIEFKKKITDGEVSLLEEKLTNVIIKQRTPLRVLHRRADLTREKYIYEVKAKKLSTKRVEMKILCQGGLYVKELVTGDEGRTTPNVSGLVNNEAKPIKLDVLNVIMKD